MLFQFTEKVYGFKITNHKKKANQNSSPSKKIGFKTNSNQLFYIVVVESVVSVFSVTYNSPCGSFAFGGFVPFKETIKLATF